MAAKTFHVYRSEDGWTVKKRGLKALTFGTKKEAVDTAIHRIRKESGQMVVHGTNGEIVEHRTYGMPKVQAPPNAHSQRSKEIAEAVNQFVLESVKSDPMSPRAKAPSK